MSIRRIVFLAGALVTLAARASAREGGLELTSITGFRANPLAVFLGKQFQVEEQPRGLYEEPKAPSLWHRLMGSKN